MDLDIDVARLRLLKADHRSQHFKLEDDLLTFYPEQITAVSERITGLEKDIAMYKEETANAVIVHEVIASDSSGGKSEDGEKREDGAVSEDSVKTEYISLPTFPPMSVLGKTYTDRDAATDALHEALKTIKDNNPVALGSYLGFNMSVAFDTYNRIYKMTLKGNISHTFDLNMGTTGFISKINYALRTMPAYLLKQAIDGHVIQLELTSVHEMVRLLSNAANNINQIAKRANETGSIYAADVEELRGRYEQLWGQAGKILQKLSEL
jgi:hypothetical protein